MCLPIFIRFSGTEPRFKCYCEVVVPVAVDEPVEVARRTAAERLERYRGKPFTIYKFRTMYADAEKRGPMLTA